MKYLAMKLYDFSGAALAMFAVMTDCLLNPFEAFDVDIYGNCL